MANDAMRVQWTDLAGPEWVRNHRLYDRMLEPFGEELVRSIAARPGERVLDVGCGFGTTAAALVDTVGPSGSVHGVDISSTMIDLARARVPAATFAVADAQVDPLGGPHDTIVSRFGVMFFEDPLAAFTNLRSATTDSGRLVFVCWRTMAENPAFTVGARSVMSAFDEPPVRPPAGAPGPFGLADGERTRSILTDAGWHDIELRPFDALLRFDIDGGEGIEDRIEMFRGSEVTRALAVQHPDRLENALDNARAELRDHLVDGVLRLGGAVWIVTASAAL